MRLVRTVCVVAAMAWIAAAKGQGIEVKFGALVCALLLVYVAMPDDTP